MAVDALVGLLVSAGVGAETAAVAAPILAGVGEGAALGAGTTAITGGDIGKGALLGGITGGFIPAGGLAGEALGLGTTAGDVLGGAAGGALGSGVTGNDPLKGALGGGVAGGISGFLSSSGDTISGPSSSTPTAGGGTGGPTGGAAATAAPASVGVVSPDVTSPVGSSVSGGGGGESVSYWNPGDIPRGTINTPDLLGPVSPETLVTPALVNSASTSGQPASSFSNSSVGKFLKNPSFGGFGDVLTSNPGAAFSAGGLALDAIRGSQSAAGLDQIKDLAAGLGTQSSQLQSYITSGQLPPGVGAGLTKASESAKAAIRSSYASRGMSGSSAEMQDLANVDSTTTTKGAEIAMQLLQSGVSESGLAGQLYQTILKESLAQDTELSTAIGRFASAAAGGGNTVQLKLG